jgi:hypothetical protein
MRSPISEGRRPKEGRTPKVESFPWERRRLAGELLVSDDTTLARRQHLQNSDFGFRVSFGLRPSGFGFPSP